MTITPIPQSVIEAGDEVTCVRCGNPMRVSWRGHIWPCKCPADAAHAAVLADLRRRIDDE